MSTKSARPISNRLPAKRNAASFLTCLLLMTLTLATGFAAAQPRYQRPPQAVLDILNAPPLPGVSLSPNRDTMLLIQGVAYPPIADLAQPRLGLAGQRINPANNGPHCPPRIVGLTLKSIADGAERKVQVPPDPYLGNLAWSPDGKRFAFTQTTPSRIELWLGDAATGKTHPVPGVAVNDVLASPIDWLADGRTLVCLSVDPRRGAPPAASAVPLGPNIQESSGKLSPVRTIQDLLKDPHDEDLFDYYAASQLVLVDVLTARARPIGAPAVFAHVAPAPGGGHLLVTRLHRPYSYLHSADAFPREVEIWDLAGRLVHTLASLPLADQVPIEGVPTGPRAAAWCPTEADTLVWAEALDGGDPKRKVPYRDRILTLAAPFNSQPVELARTEQRYAGIDWLEKDGLYLISDYDRDRRWTRTRLASLRAPGQPGRLVWDRSAQDRYNSPGSPLNRALPSGHRAVLVSAGAIFLAGSGATPAGDRPFLDRLNLETLKTERLFRCNERSYESVVALLSPEGPRFITERESPSEPPNYFIHDAATSQTRALTAFPDPAPQLRAIHKELVTYQRPDGVGLSFTLYLPPGYKKGQRLPTLLWAYPREYNDPATAGQVSGSTQRFTSISGISHLFLLTQGYAILDSATMPVVGDPETMNDTYIDQVVASAKAAIDKAVELGVTDRARVGVGGHSYGAFMTANLLAHSNLFRAGIARSGAYNRTLTPFGFQAERRTLWEAPQIYAKISPFMFADRIKAPILLIHGEDDDNNGTFPIQSERMYQAIKGNGGLVRYVTLPHEAHAYRARESVEHTLYEMISWMDRHVRDAPPPEIQQAEK